VQVSRYFAEILLSFLVGKLPELSAAPEAEAATLLRLFKLVFGSITLFPENEPVLRLSLAESRRDGPRSGVGSHTHTHTHLPSLFSEMAPRPPRGCTRVRPHLATIVTSALRYASASPSPAHYYSLLRALFKSIGGGKFESLYKEFLPLLPSLLPGLIHAHARARTRALREVLLELCLTLPARLSALLPFLRPPPGPARRPRAFLCRGAWFASRHLLMEPVRHALRASSEQVGLALRTLEFWASTAPAPSSHSRL